MYFRSDPIEIFKSLDKSKAAYCVKHTYQPNEKNNVWNKAS